MKISYASNVHVQGNAKKKLKCSICLKIDFLDF